MAGLLAADASAPTVHLTTDLFYRAIRTGFVAEQTAAEVRCVLASGKYRLT